MDDGTLGGKDVPIDHVNVKVARVCLLKDLQRSDLQCSWRMRCLAAYRLVPTLEQRQIAVRQASQRIVLRTRHVDPRMQRPQAQRVEARRHHHVKESIPKCHVEHCVGVHIRGQACGDQQQL